MINKLCIYTTVSFLLGSLLIGSCLYLIQSSVCSEIKLIMGNPTHYNLFIGCQMGINEEAGDLQSTIKEDEEVNSEKGSKKK